MRWRDINAQQSAVIFHGRRYDLTAIMLRTAVHHAAQMLPPLWRASPDRNFSLLPPVNHF